MKKKKMSVIRSFLVTLTLIGLCSSVSACSAAKLSQTVINAKKFYAVTVDANDTKWFLTELGIVSFNGEKWDLLPNQGKEFRDIAFDVATESAGFWIATSAGVMYLKSIADICSAVMYTAENSGLISDDVVKVAISNNFKWFATDQGVSVYFEGRWLREAYDDLYPPMLFEAFPITDIFANPIGDTLYVATSGVGVSRIHKQPRLDAIVGASEYAIWGPIDMPSDDVKSFHLDKQGVKWLGTDSGIARHIGDDTLDNWTVFTTARGGLVHNYVQAITDDQDGKIWFGTQGGISVFDGNTFTNYTTANGLSSNNILCLTVDNAGVVWIGTDAGVNSFSDGTFKSY